jgi:Helix-turn-helix domain
MTYMEHALAAEGLTPSERLVLIYLAHHADTYDECRPSLVGLAKSTALGRTTVVRSLRSLEAKGIVTVLQRPGKRTNVYTLNLVVVPQWDSISSSSTDSDTAELRSSENPSGSDADPFGAAPWDTITPTPVVKRRKRVRPGQIEDAPDPEDVPPVRQVKLKKPEDYGAGDLGRHFVESLRQTPRAGEVGYKTAGGMMKRLLAKGANPDDVYHAVDAWVADTRAMSELRTGTTGAWVSFSSFYSTYKNRKRRDALVTSNDEASWEGYI